MNQDINYNYERIIEENEEKDLNKLMVNYDIKVRNLNHDLIILKVDKNSLYNEESIRGINITIKVIEHNKDFYEGLVKYINNKVVNNKND